MPLWLQLCTRSEQLPVTDKQGACSPALPRAVLAWKAATSGNATPSPAAATHDGGMRQRGTDCCCMDGGLGELPECHWENRHRLHWRLPAQLCIHAAWESFGAGLSPHLLGQAAAAVLLEGASGSCRTSRAWPDSAGRHTPEGDPAAGCLPGSAPEGPAHHRGWCPARLQLQHRPPFLQAGRLRYQAWGQQVSALSLERRKDWGATGPRLKLAAPQRLGGGRSPPQAWSAIKTGGDRSPP